jgi:catechol 2,3-dioxygenase-like lactoylglutathione lyase family enzyme
MPAFPADDMEITTLRVVSDMDRARAWYRDVLGAELVREYGESSTVMKFVGHWLLLVTGGGPTRDKPTVEFAPPPSPDTVSTQLTLRVQNCQAAYETLKGRGAEFLAEPVKWDHGEIRAFFRDPDGHLFEISELVSAP